MKNKRKNIYDQLVSWSWGWLTPRPSAGDEWPHSVAFLSGWHHWWLGLGPLYGWLQSCRFRRADEAEIYQTVPTEMARRAVRLPACWPRQKQRGVLLQEKKKQKKTSQPLFTVSFIRKEKKKKKEATQEMTWLKVNAAPFSCTTTLNPPLQLHMSCPALHSPLSQAFLSEARNDDGIKGLLCARNSDAQWSVISLQLHCVDYGAWHFQLIYSMQGQRIMYTQDMKTYNKLFKTNYQKNDW